jgi:hypothetical protein
VPAETLEQVCARLERIEVLLTDTLNRDVRLGNKEIASRQGVGLTKLSAEPWRLPQFGKAALGEARKKRYSLAEVKEWETHLEAHRLEWERMTPSQRLECRGIAPEQPAKARKKTGKKPA